MRSTMRLATLCFGLLSTAAVAQLYEKPSPNLQKQLVAQSPCGLLAAQFPTQVFLPGHANYTRSQSEYWSGQQADLKPACRFFPQKAKQIQEALADVIIPRNVSIAISSGGHSSVQGASNVDSGITFDMSHFTEVNFFLDGGKATWLGVGSRWKDVYPILEDANLSVAGSRSANGGVGGYVLGGGSSWYSNQHGWAIDSVVEFEVVTPQADILQVSPIKNEDIFWALKGSLGAFGIVTKIKMKTIPHNGVYSGSISYEQKHMPQLCDALDGLTRGAERNPTAQGYLSFTWLESKKNFAYYAYLMDTDGKDPKGSFPQFQAIPHQENTLRSTTIGGSAKEIDKSNLPGLRRSGFTLTAKMDKATMLALHDLVKDSTAKVNFDKSGVLGVIYEPLTRPHLQAQNNFFNMGAVSHPLLMVSVDFGWSDATKDSYFEKTSRDLRLAMEADLTKRKALQPFIHPNYAARDQNPYGRLAPLDKKILKSIKRKYDPNNNWEKIVPGIWHI